MHKLAKAEIMREVKDYLYITLGLISYSLGWAAFLLPYQITTGGTTGISAIIYYSTGFPIQWSYFIINAVLMTFAFRILGPRFSIKTTYAIFSLTFLLWLFQLLVNNYVVAPDMTPEGQPLLLGPGQDFMACIIGAVMCGIGLGIVFNYNGSTGGTDIIAAIVNKYKDVTLGRMIMLCDIIIITSCYFIFHDWRRVIFGFVTLFIIGIVLDWIINSARQSVQFLIFSKKYDEIADSIIKDADRGVTVLDGTGWYSKKDVKVLVVLAKKRQSLDIFRLVKRIDPNAFISQSSVIGVYGEGFDKLKVK
ncbi:YitT family protein [Bacteroides acidifaciens]|uniref:YitT family protein n=1 Tax=Bacteroides acidifaciens TaxID=85831 RepID=UPI00158E0ACB|nr:YitT family protein [Bacteroides acidifaciens]